MKRFFRLSAAALALLSGCASLLHPRQVEDLQLIQTIGFDGGIGDMTVSVSSGEASEDAVSAQLAARGASIQTAVQRLQDFSPREELFFAHIRYAAVGEDCARGGITPILDYFERGTQTQLSVPLFVVKGESAYTLIAANGGENEITAALSSLEADTERQRLPARSPLPRRRGAFPKRRTAQRSRSRPGTPFFAAKRSAAFSIPTPRSARIFFSALRRRQATSSPTGAAAR